MSIKGNQGYRQFHDSGEVVISFLIKEPTVSLNKKSMSVRGTVLPNFPKRSQKKKESNTSFIEQVANVVGKKYLIKMKLWYRHTKRDYYYLIGSIRSAEVKRTKKILLSFLYAENTHIADFVGDFAPRCKKEELPPIQVSLIERRRKSNAKNQTPSNFQKESSSEASPG
jgi:hypothetical protein